MDALGKTRVDYGKLLKPCWEVNPGEDFRSVMEQWNLGVQIHSS